MFGPIKYYKLYLSKISRFNVLEQLKTNDYPEMASSLRQKSYIYKLPKSESNFSWVVASLVITNLSVSLSKW